MPQAFLNRFGPEKVAAPGGDQDAAVPDDLSGKGDAGDYFVEGGSNTKKYTEPKTIEELKIDTDDPALQYALGQLLLDGEYSWVFELPEFGKSNFY